MKSKVIVLFVAATLIGIQLATQFTGEAAPPWAFEETFNGAPGAPAPITSPHWDFVIGGSTAGSMAGHGPDCGPPPALHPITGGVDSVFQCKDHMMTTVRSGYSVLSFTPRQLFDWNGRTGTLEFDTNLYGFGRSWWDIYISPEDEMLVDIQHPDEGGAAELYPKRAVRISFLGGVPEVAQVVDYKQTYKYRAAQNYGQTFPSDPDTYNSAIRRTFRISLSSTSWKFEILKQDGTFWTHTGNFSTPLSFSRGLVHFENHAYNPDKDGISPQHTTFHWDNIRFDGPVVPARKAVESADRYDNCDGQTKIRFNMPNAGAGILMGALVSQFLWSPIESNITNDSHWAQFRVNGGPYQDVQFRKPVLTGLSTRHASTIDPPINFIAGENVVEFKFTRPPNATWHNGCVTGKAFEIQSGSITGSPPPPPAPPTNTTVPATATVVGVPPTATVVGPPPTATVGPLPPTATVSAPPPTATSPANPPQATATAVKTATPMPSATSAPPPPQPTPPPMDWTKGWITSSNANPLTVTRGGTATITVKVTSEVARSALVDVEVYAPNGQRVKQAVFDAQAFSPNVAKSYPMQWTVPANAGAGQYTVRIGIFSVGWGTLYHWNHNGSTFNVTSGGTAPRAAEE